MGKHFFDFEDGDFAHSISDNMAIDSDGDLLMRMGIIWQWIWIQEKYILYPVGLTMKMMTKITAAVRLKISLPPVSLSAINHKGDNFLTKRLPYGLF